MEPQAFREATMKRLTPQLIGAIISLVLPYTTALVFLSVITEPALAQEVSVEERRAEADRLFQEGVELRHREQYDVALEKFQTALSAYEAFDDYKGQADALNQLGNIYLSLNQHDRASELYQQALALRQDLKPSTDDTRDSSVPNPPQSPENITFQPADISFPGNRTSPATRAALLIESPIALIPETNHGQTTKPYPTLFIYLPEAAQSNQNLEISFHLMDEQDELIHTATRNYPEAGGILGIRFEELKNMAPLEEDQQYQWYINITENSNPTILHLSGWIQRVETTSPEVNSTEISLEDELYYAVQEDAWYDALAALFELKQRNPNNSRISVSLREILTSAGLHDIDIGKFIGYWSGTPHAPEGKPLATETNSTSPGGYFRPPPDIATPPGSIDSTGTR